MMLKEQEVKDMKEHDRCVTCNKEWSLHTELERYCEGCATHIITVYYTPLTLPTTPYV